MIEKRKKLRRELETEENGHEFRASAIFNRENGEHGLGTVNREMTFEQLSRDDESCTALSASSSLSKMPPMLFALSLDKWRTMCLRETNQLLTFNGATMRSDATLPRVASHLALLGGANPRTLPVLGTTLEAVYQLGNVE